MRWLIFQWVRLFDAIELYPGKGAQMVRSAGNMGQLMAKEGKYALVRLPSGELRNVPINCKATIGQVSNIDHENVNLGKAGRTRHLGIRPTVRGSVMNHAIIRTAAARENLQSDVRDLLLLGASRRSAIKPVRSITVLISLL